LAKLTDNEKELANWTNIATGVYGQFGSSLPIEGLAEAANETAKVGQVTGPLADALNWTGISAEQLGLKLKANTEENEEWNKAIKEGASSEDLFNMALSECSTEQERQQLIMNTLNGIYSESADTFRDNNEAVMEANRAQSALTDAQARLGAVAEPVITTVKQGFADLLTTLLDLVGNVNMEEFTSKIKDGFAILTDTVIPAIKDGFQWVIDHGDIIMSVLKGIVAGMVAYSAYSTALQIMQNGWKSLEIVQKASAAAQWLINAAMNANPMMLIVTVITAVIVALVTFIAKNEDARAKFTEIWQSVKDFFVNVWDGIVNFFTETIPNAFKKVIDWVKSNFDSLLLFLINPFAGLFDYFYDNNAKFKEFVDNAVKHIKELPGKVWTWLKNTIDKVKTWATDMGTKAKDAATKFVNNVVNFFKELPGKVWTWLKNVVSKIVTWGSELASKGKAAALKLFNAVVDKIKEIPSKVATVGKDLVRGIMEGITNSLSWIKNRLKEWVGNVTNFVKKIFKIASPSKLWRDQIGVWLARGVAVGIDKGKKHVLDSLTGLVSDTRTEVQKLLDDENEVLLDSEKFYAEESKRIAKEREDAKYKETLDGINNEQTVLDEFNKELLESEKIYQKEKARIEAKETKNQTDAQKKADQAYLDGLKEKAEKERKLYDAQMKDQEAIKKAERDKEKQEQEKAQDAYLEGLKATAEKERALLNAHKKDIEASKNSIINAFKDIVNEAMDEVSALDELQKSIADKFKGEGSLTYRTQTFVFGDTEETHTKLADVGADNAKLKEYNKMLDELADKRGILPDEIAGYLSEMGLEEGKKYVQALLDASDEEYKTYVSDLEEKARLAEEISKKTTSNQVTKLKDELLSQFGQTTMEFFDIGEESARNFGGGFVTYLAQLLGNTRELLTQSFDKLSDSDFTAILDKARETANNIKAKVSGTSSSINNGNSGFVGPVVKNYTQNIYSPTPANRVTIYRNTKNLLGLA
jgi:phage-related protein